MLDICTCIISCIIFSDIVPDVYFHNTDTWDSCDMHYIDYMMFLDLPCYFILWSCVLAILLVYYTIVTRPGYLMFVIYMSHHACMVLLYMIYRLNFPVIVITFSSWYCQTYCSFILPTITTSLYSLFYRSFTFVHSCWSASDRPLLLFFSI